MSLSRFAPIALLFTCAALLALIVLSEAGSPPGEPWWSVAAQSESDDEDVRIEVARHGHFTVSDTSPSIGQTVTIETSLTGTDGAAARGIAVIISGYNGHFTSASSLTGSTVYYRFKNGNYGDESFEVTSSEARTMTVELVAFGWDVSDGRYWSVYPDVFQIAWSGTAPENTPTPTPTATSVGAPTATPTPTATPDVDSTPTPTPTAASGRSCRLLPTDASGRSEPPCRYPGLSEGLEALICSPRGQEVLGSVPLGQLTGYAANLRIEIADDKTHVVNFLDRHDIEYHAQSGDKVLIAFAADIALWGDMSNLEGVKVISFHSSTTPITSSSVTASEDTTPRRQTNQKVDNNAARGRRRRQSNQPSHPPTRRSALLPPAGTRSWGGVGLEWRICDYEASLDGTDGRRAKSQPDLAVERIPVFIFPTEDVEPTSIIDWIATNDVSAVVDHPSGYGVEPFDLYGQWLVTWNAPISLLGPLSRRSDVRAVELIPQPERDVQSSSTSGWVRTSAPFVHGAESWLALSGSGRRQGEGRDYRPRFRRHSGSVKFRWHHRAAVCELPFRRRLGRRRFRLRTGLARR